MILAWASPFKIYIYIFIFLLLEFFIRVSHKYMYCSSCYKCYKKVLLNYLCEIHVWTDHFNKHFNKQSTYLLL